MPPRATPTEADLLAAWQQRRRPDWPATYDDAMATPVYAGLVRATAIARVLAARHRDAQLAFHQPAAPVPAPATATATATTTATTTTPPRPPAAALPVLRQVVDMKRRASGERDDD